MADSPIPKQPGLSQEELYKMKPVEQKYRPSGDTNILKESGVENQKSKIANGIHKILSEHFKRLETIDSKDEYANEKELELLADDLADFTINIISAQKITIQTITSTSDTLNGVATNVQTGVSSPMVVTGSGTGKGNSTKATAE